MSNQIHTPAPANTGTARTRRRRIAFVGVAVLLSLGAAASTVWVRNADPARTASAPTAKAPAPALELLPRDTALVALGRINQSIALTGTLQPLHRIEVKSQLPGQVVSVTAREGERVRRGQVLATLDAADLQARLRDRLAVLDGGQAQLALATRTRENNAALLKQNFISQAAFDNALSGDRTAEASVRSLQAQVEQARKALADAFVRSPIDGIVAERIAEPGLSVPVNATLMSVQDLSEMELEVLVPTSQIPAVRIGQSASFSIEGFGTRRFEGKVERISPSAAAGSRSIAVYLRLTNPGQELRGGMFAQGAIVTQRSAQVVVVPAAALRDDAGLPYVLRIGGDRLVDQPLQLGARDADTGLVEVTFGLQAGDRVVISSAPNLKAGQPVQIVAPVAKSSAAQPNPKQG
ncbi:MAG: efflux RND transporter periplasmic adaptor subunit [Burkholderiaceae bacterium]